MIALMIIGFALIITILVHELGHLIVALLMKVKVEAFSLGFGKPIWKKTIKGIEFRISPFLLGGYCRLEGEKSNKKEGWLKERYSKKVAILLAGVTTNFLTAFICYLIMYKSIPFGIWVDWTLMKSMFTKDYFTIIQVISTIKPNIFLLQLSLMNLFAGLSNILPIPALDGGYLFLLPLEKIYKEKFPEVLEKIVGIGFKWLMVLQFVLLYYIWVM